MTQPPSPARRPSSEHTACPRVRDAAGLDHGAARPADAARYRDCSSSTRSITERPRERPSRRVRLAKRAVE
eukprot:702354-Prymnesium_polylepis.1